MTLNYFMAVMKFQEATFEKSFKGMGDIDSYESKWTEWELEKSIIEILLI